MAGGIRFGQYVLLRRIARGGMAEVFLAQQQGLEGFDRRVAVKRILPHLVDSPDFVKMFLGEAKLAAQLTHPNVVHIYDFGKVAGDYFIAMEYVEGVHAGQLFKLGEKGNPAGSRLSPTLVARLGADAAAALHYAHELRGPGGKPLGLVHRDVSPANLMVSFDGVVKLCDFGIAKAAALSDQLTNPGQVKGKYAYMSPEQTIASPLDGRSDVFSLGIVLWELLAGKTIVGRGDAVESMRAIRDGKLERIEMVAPETPPALAKAIGWALETKRERRATAAELAQALEAVIKSSPELATPMQLATWLRARFTRDTTGDEELVLPESGGTGASSGTAAGGGTLAAPGTAAGSGTLAGPPTASARPTIPRQGEAVRALPGMGPADGRTKTPPMGGARTATPPPGGARTTTPPPGVLRGPAVIAASRMPMSAEDAMEGAETVARDPEALPKFARPTKIAAAVRPPEDAPAPPLVIEATRRPNKRARRSAPMDPTAQLQLSDLDEVEDDEPDDEPDDEELDDPFDDDGNETVARSGSRRPMMSSAAAVVPTMFEVPSISRKFPASPAERPITPVVGTPISATVIAGDRGSDRARAPSGDRASGNPGTAKSGVRARPARNDATSRVPRRGPRVAVSIGVLLAIGVASFLIALAARSRSHPAAAPVDAAVVHDASGLSVVPLLPDAGSAAVTVDAAVTSDAGSGSSGSGSGSGSEVDAGVAGEPAGILDVTTTPPGATVKVGDQSRTAPAKLALPAGHYVVIAELRGYVAERREVDMERNEHVAQEIVFTHRLSSPHGPDHPDRPLPTTSGKLTVKTTPYSEVFTSAGNSLGQTPLADIDLPAGSHLLTFKNPVHADVTRRVTITAGKTTKLQFNLP